MFEARAIVKMNGCDIHFTDFDFIFDNYDLFELYQ